MLVLDIEYFSVYKNLLITLQRQKIWKGGRDKKKRMTKRESVCVQVSNKKRIKKRKRERER